MEGLAERLMLPSMESLAIACVTGEVELIPNCVMPEGKPPATENSEKLVAPANSPPPKSIKSPDTRVGGGGGGGGGMMTTGASAAGTSSDCLKFQRLLGGIVMSDKPFLHPLQLD